MQNKSYKRNVTWSGSMSLQVLVATPGRIYNREQLVEKIYPDDRFVGDRTIDGHIKKLRRKLEAVDRKR